MLYLVNSSCLWFATGTIAVLGTNGTKGLRIHTGLSKGSVVLNPIISE